MFSAQTLEHPNTRPRVEIKNSYPILVLSTGYEPMFKTNWKRAISAVIGGRAEVIESHEELTISTVDGSIPFPTVVRFTTGIFVAQVKKINRVPKLTRRNVWLRDSGCCQYCEKKIGLDSSTIDHVRPRSKNGQHTWDNVVLACVSCNQRKGASLLENSNMALSKNMSQVMVVK